MKTSTILRNLQRQADGPLATPVHLAGKVQTKARHCANEDEARAFLGSLPKKTATLGIIERAEGADGSVVVSAAWPSSDYDPAVYKSHPQWDAIDRALLDAGDPDVLAATNARGWRRADLMARLVGAGRSVA